MAQEKQARRTSPPTPADQGLSAFVNIDRDTAARLAITPGGGRRRALFGLRPADHLDHLHRDQPVPGDPGIAAQRRHARRAWRGVQLQSTGGSTPLSAVATIKEQTAPLQVRHVAQFPAATVGFDTGPGVSLGAAVSDIRKVADKVGQPAGITHDLPGRGRRL